MKKVVTTTLMSGITKNTIAKSVLNTENDTFVHQLGPFFHGTKIKNIIPNIEIPFEHKINTNCQYKGVSPLPVSLCSKNKLMLTNPGIS
jgi:hypothetical protein